MSSSERFGYEWDTYSFMDENYEKQFKNWTFPLSENDFKNKVILDASCGMGRNSYWPLKWGAKELVAFDVDERSVKRAKETLKEFKNADVVYKSIYDIDWKDRFDTAFSIGVIHHLKDPKKALQNIVTALKTDGTLLVWVYSYEGNEWIPKYVDPVRKNITSKLPVSIVHFLSYFC
jgi:SAM-dependent methyltransferase